MKKLVLLIISCLIFLTSCMEDNTQLAKDEFSKYFNGKNEVVLNIEDNIYFENHILKCDDLNPGNMYGSISFYNGNIYYLSLDTSKMGFKNDYINVYSTDFYGKNTKKIYSKHLNITSKVHIQTEGDSYYIQYIKNNLTVIDKYTISTNVYENIDSGKDCSLSNYLSKEETNKYKFTIIENPSIKEHGKFIITNTETNEERIIDDEYLKNTIYIESMEMFNYEPNRVDISNGHILLTYGIGAGDGWTYPHLVFEYDFENDALEYKLLVFPFDSVPIEIIYIE